MTNLTEKEQCRQGCTWWGAGIGLGAALLFWVIFGWGFFLSVILGIIFGVAAFFVLSNMWCDKISDAPVASAATPSAAASSGASATTTTTTTTTAAPAAPAAQASADVAPAAPEKAAFSGMKPSTPLKGQEELAARKGTYKYEAPKAEKAPAKKTAAPKAAAKKAAAPAEAATAAPKKAAPAKKAAAPKKKAAPKKAAAAPTAPAAFADIPAETVHSQPETLTQARAGGADDLKLISGVGPKLEQTLNELGFYHFDQIAKWGAQEIAWVDARVRFKGRIARDNWMEQAKILAAGGETEFSARNKKT